MTGNIGRLMLQKAAELEPICFPQPQYAQGDGQRLVESLATFWLTISCGYVLHIEKFSEYAKEVDSLLRQIVPWHPGVPSIHLSISKKSPFIKHPTSHQLISQTLALT